MKRIAIVLLFAAGLAVGSARADDVHISGSVNFGTPMYGSPGYVQNGYWRDVATNVWIPAHWETRSDFWGNAVNTWVPGHYEVRTQRVWTPYGYGNGYGYGGGGYYGYNPGYYGNNWAQHEYWEHEHEEHEEHERREHQYRDHDHDGDRH